MKKINLQMFAAEVVQGKDLVYLYRILDEATTKPATTLAFTTENERSVSQDSESTVTKDGTMRTPGAPEIEITATSYLAKGDDLAERLEAAMLGNKLIEIWEANLAEPSGTGNKFKGKYFQGYLTEKTVTSSAEEAVELSLTFAINGTGVDGTVTVTAEQQEIAAYVFKDTTAAGA